MAPSSVSHHPSPPLPVWWGEPPPPCPRLKVNPDYPSLSTPTLLRAQEGWMMSARVTRPVLGDRMLEFSWFLRALNLGVETVTRYLCRNQTWKFPKLG